jgi:hypothetical protein
MVASILMLAGAGAAKATAAVEQQVVDLHVGWNAVYLYVQPTVAAPDTLFAGQPIEQVTVWVPGRARVASLTDPDAVPTKSPEWHVWHPPGHPAAFLNTLMQVQARRGMLIKASAATRLVIAGEPIYKPVQWSAPAFHLLGFDVDAEQAPTFARWFAGSRAHSDLKVQKLVNGVWLAVNPHETMTRGVAYWVWCREGSDFQGPLAIDLPLGGDGLMALPNGALPINGSIANRGSLPMSIHISATGGLPLQAAPNRDPMSTLGVLNFAIDGAQRIPLRLGRTLDATPTDNNLVESAILRLRGGGCDVRILLRP